MRGCLTENELLLFLDGQMPSDETARQQEHIDSCPTCFALFTALGSADVSATTPGTSAAVSTPTAAGVTASGDLVGTQIGQYRITRQLGRGGMGIVYEAVHHTIGQVVAVKILKPAISHDPTIVKRFLLEARAVIIAQHPGLVKIYDFGQVPSGELYILMELLEGETLGQRLARLGKLPEEDSVRIARQIASAMATAHYKGIVHRDLKPDNVYIVADKEAPGGERTKILDFGLAKILTPNDSREAPTAGLQTRDGAVLGTPVYMSPEQCRGSSEIDDRADVYALGIMLFEMLTGQRPFSATTVEALLLQHLTVAPPPLAEHLPGASAKLTKLTAAMLAKRADQRPSMQQVEEVLAGLAAKAGAHVDVASETRPMGRLTAILGSYIGFSFTALQCVDLAVNRYALSPELTTLCLYVIFLLLPSALICGLYFSGLGGRVRMRWLARLGVPANLILLVATTMMVFHGKELGVTTTRVQLKDDDGKTVQREVPKSAFIKHLAIFFFENDSGDLAQNWLQLAIPDMLELDLSQDPFVVTREGSSFSARLQQASLDEYSRVPLALKQDIARTMHMDYLVSGSFTRDKDSFIIRYAVYKAQSAQPIARHIAAGLDVLPLIDEMSVQLKRDIGVPSRQVETTTDLPIAEIATASMPALHDYVLGTNSWWFRNDRPVTQRLLQQAVATDPRFALAFFQIALFYEEGNQLELARAALAAAKQNEYRLNERMRFEMNALRFSCDKDRERQDEVLRQWSTLYPEDAQAWRARWRLYQGQGRLDEAIAAALREYALDPEDPNMVGELAYLFKRAGRSKESLPYLEKYEARFPKDARGPVYLGDLYRSTGEYEKARTFYQKALVIDPENASGLRGECVVDSRLGQAEDALSQCQRAIARSNTPGSRASSYKELGDYYLWRGVWRKALEQYQLGLDELRKESSPQDVVSSGMNFGIVLCHLELGQIEAARQRVKNARSSLKTAAGHGALQVHLQDVYLHVKSGDVDGAVSLIHETETLFPADVANDIVRRFLMEMQAKIQEHLGQWQQALSLYSEMPRPPHEFQRAVTLMDIGRCQRHLDQLKEAEASLKQGLTLWPSHPEIHYELALVYQQAGNFPEARQHVQASLQVWSDADSEYQAARKARELAVQLASSQK